MTSTICDQDGLIYLNNRYHDPNLGVFISVDPLVQVTGEPYIYASANPTTLSDPLGLAACEDDGNCPWSTGKCTSLCGPGHLNDSQRSTISKNPDRFSQVLYDCWYQGASACEDMRDRMGRDEGLLDAAQLILLGFAQQGGFVVDEAFLMSPYYSNNQNVNFVTGIGPRGEVVVSLVHAPSANFKQMAAGGLQVVGMAMTVIEIGGLISCAATGGGGCAVGGLAGAVGAAVDVSSAALACSDGASNSCAWSAGVATASVATFGIGEVASAYLNGAGLFQGAIAQAYRTGDVYASIGVSMFDIAGYGIVEQHDSSLGIHMYGVVL